MSLLCHFHLEDFQFWKKEELRFPSMKCSFWMHPFQYKFEDCTMKPSWAPGIQRSIRIRFPSPKLELKFPQVPCIRRRPPRGGIQFSEGEQDESKMNNFSMNACWTLQKIVAKVSLSMRCNHRKRSFECTWQMKESLYFPIPCNFWNSKVLFCQFCNSIQFC